MALNTKRVLAILNKSDPTKQMLYYYNGPKIITPYEIAYKEFKKMLLDAPERFEQVVHNGLQLIVRVHNLKGEYYCKTKVSTVAKYEVEEPFIPTPRPAKLVQDYKREFLPENVPFNIIEDERLKYNNLYLRLFERRIKQLFHCKRSQVFYHRVIETRERTFDYRIVLPADLIERVLPFLAKYPFSSRKDKFNYHCFKEVVELMAKEGVKPQQAALERITHLQKLMDNPEIFQEDTVQIN
jgi:hypothetical protein